MKVNQKRWKLMKNRSNLLVTLDKHHQGKMFGASYGTVWGDVLKRIVLQKHNLDKFGVTRVVTWSLVMLNFQIYKENSENTVLSKQTRLI